MQLPKPPKLFSMKKNAETNGTQSAAEEDTPRVWSPPPEPPMQKAENIPAQSVEEDFSRFAPPSAQVSEGITEPETVAETPVEDEFIPEPEDNHPATKESMEEDPILSPMDEEKTVPEPESAPVEDEETSEFVSEVVEETIAESEKGRRDEMMPEVEEEPIKEQALEPKNESIKGKVMKEENFERYARPKEQPVEVVQKTVETKQENSPIEQEQVVTAFPDSDGALPPEENEKAIYKLLGKDQNIVRAKSVSSIPFADIWYTAEKVAYIRDESTRFALVPFLSDDLSDFYKALEQGYTGQSSYAIRYAGEAYRVERIITLSGVQYNCRKMPGSVPDISTLGLPKHIVDQLLTLSREAGLILFGGPTGMGKTTSASALMKKFLEENGGFMYTIEDPPEMPLDGLYRAANGGLGLCKQCPVDNERWGDGIKSALRSRPRYILVGEIRTPETASQVLRAATSGHLVLSTIHASTVEDSLESIIKYASGAGLTESLAADLLARGILAVVHQKLEGETTLRPVISAAFANPHLTGGDQMRSLIRNNNINLQTLIEAQSSRLFQGRPLFEDK